jgi:hypothetical protein
MTRSVSSSINVRGRSPYIGLLVGTGHLSCKMMIVFLRIPQDPKGTSANTGDSPAQGKPQAFLSRERVVCIGRTPSLMSNAFCKRTGSFGHLPISEVHFLGALYEVYLSFQLH